MTTAPERISPGAPGHISLRAPERISSRTSAGRAEGPTTFPDDQLYMLKLTLELQIEALLLTLGSSAVVSRETKTTPDGAGRPVPGRPGADRIAPEGATPDLAGRERTGTGAAAADLPWEKWLAEDLELACSLTRDCVGDGIPLPSSMGIVTSRRPGFVVESLAARYSAMAAVVGEMLGRTDARQHATAVARLQETRARCEERLDALLGETPQAAAERLFAPAEAGHYLG
jgi:hypothetical protein